MHIVIIGLLLSIVGSLGSALSAMNAGPGSSAKMARALTWRISLSITLFLVLFVGYHFGWIAPHGAH